MLLSAPSLADRGRLRTYVVALALCSISSLALLRRCLLKLLLYRLLKCVRFVGCEIVVSIPNLVQRALNHKLIIAVQLRLVAARVRQLYVNLLPPLVPLLPLIVIMQRLLLQRRGVLQTLRMHGIHHVLKPTSGLIIRLLHHFAWLLLLYLLLLLLLDCPLLHLLYHLAVLLRQVQAVGDRCLLSASLRRGIEGAGVSFRGHVLLLNICVSKSIRIYWAVS